MTVLAREVKEATATLDQARVLHGNKALLCAYEAHALCEVETFNADERSLYKDIQAGNEATL